MKLSVQVRLSPKPSIVSDITQLVEWRNHNPCVVGSSPSFANEISECSAAGSVSVLGIEGHVFKSHHSDYIFFESYYDFFTLFFYNYFIIK